MKITETNLKFTHNLSTRTKTNYIIVHHRAGNGDVLSIHTQHIGQSYSGIGYHYYIRKDGSIYTGRPLNTVGAHCLNYNGNSVGICFEGNFETETMGDIQKKAGAELVAHLKGIYKSAVVCRHSDFNATACPGKNFPFDEISSGKVPKKELVSADDIIRELTEGKLKVEINDIKSAVKCLEEAKEKNTSLYWILYKIANKE